MRRVIPAPTDEELAAAEQTENARRANRIAEIEDEQEERRLASAGDPDAAAALASVLGGRPVGDENGETEIAGRGSNEKKHGSPNPKPRRGKAPRRGTAGDNGRNGGESTREPEHDNLEGDQKLAYRLMDLAHKKWAKTAQRDVRKANRDLAIDLGKDMVLYLRANLIRLGDGHDVIQKLIMAKGAEQTAAPDDNFEEDLEDLRAQLRGGQ